MIPTEKIVVAAEKRRSIRTDQTNAVRLLDGSGDGLPGLTIDDFAGRWIIQTLDEREPTLDPTLGYRSLYWKPLLKTSNNRPETLGRRHSSKTFLGSGVRAAIRDRFSSRIFARSLSRPAHQSQQASQPRQRHDASEYLLLYLCFRGGSSRRRRVHSEPRSVAPLSGLGKTELRNQSDQLRPSRFYLWRCLRLAGTFSAARQKIRPHHSGSADLLEGPKVKSLQNSR